MAVMACERQIEMTNELSQVGDNLKYVTLFNG